MTIDKHEKFIKKVKEQVGDEYTFLGEYKYAKEKIPVIHNKCGHKYSVTPDNFTGVLRRRCPKCSVKKKKQCVPFSQKEFKDIIYQEVKNEYTVLSEYKGQDIKFLIRHNHCGTEYMTSYKNFRRGRRCSKCKNDKRRKPQCIFEEEVETLGNGEYKLISEYHNNKEKTWFRHLKCGHEFSSSPSNFIGGNRCPKCKSSKGEKRVMDFLDGNGFEYKTQAVYRDLIDVHPLRFDFAVMPRNSNKEILIEYDGEQHFHPVDVWGGEESLKKNKKRDKMKNDYARKKGHKLIRIPYWEFNNIENILKEELKENDI